MVLVPVSTIFRFWRRHPIAVNFHDLIVEHQNQAKPQMAAETNDESAALPRPAPNTSGTPLLCCIVTKRSCKVCSWLRIIQWGFGILCTGTTLGTWEFTNRITCPVPIGAATKDFDLALISERRFLRCSMERLDLMTFPFPLGLALPFPFTRPKATNATSWS